MSRLLRTGVGRASAVAAATLILAGGGVATAVLASATTRGPGDDWQFRYRATSSCSGSTIVHTIRYDEYVTDNNTDGQVPASYTASFSDHFYLPQPGDPTRADYTRQPADLVVERVGAPEVRRSERTGDTTERLLVRNQVRMSTASAGIAHVVMVGWGVHLNFAAAVCPGGAPVRVAGTGPR